MKGVNAKEASLVRSVLTKQISSGFLMPGVREKQVPQGNADSSLLLDRSPQKLTGKLFSRSTFTDVPLLPRLAPKSNFAAWLPLLRTQRKLRYLQSRPSLRSVKLELSFSSLLSGFSQPSPPLLFYQLFQILHKISSLLR